VIGSDQVAALGGRILGKPGDLEAAAEQLRSSSGQAVEFYTAVAVAALAKGLERFHVELTTVRFRELSDQQIANYLQQETPFDCAGSFKVEGLGIALFTSIAGDDPTALEGLPLIQLTELLGLADVKII
jgi:septum formation protein